MINFCRTLQERFYIESFATNFSNVLRENFVLPSLPLLSSYSSDSLPSVAVSVPLASYILFIPSVPPLTVFLLPSLLYVLSLLLLFLFHLERIKEIKRVKEVKEVQGGRGVIGYKDSEEE